MGGACRAARTGRLAAETPSAVFWATAGIVASFASRASAQALQGPKDEPSALRDEHRGGAETAWRNPLRGSTFVLDQSLSTQAAHVELQPEQSYVPFYGLWLSLRPRWSFSEKVTAQARLDYYKELTNSQPTTLAREDVFGDVWTDVTFSTPLADDGFAKGTQASVGLRALWPTSKVSQADGIYVTTGVAAALSQKVPLRGPAAPALLAAHVGVALSYLHPFSGSTTPTHYQGFAYPRENTDGFSFVSTQITGQTLAAHTLYGTLDLGLEVTPRLGLTVDWVLVNQWHYAPTSACVATATGCAEVPRAGDNQFVQLGWFIAQAQYDVLPELSIGLGYYNLANTVGPNGKANSLFAGGENSELWSPSARVFVDLTAHLDALYADLSGADKAPGGGHAHREAQRRPVPRAGIPARAPASPDGAGREVKRGP